MAGHGIHLVALDLPGQAGLRWSGYPPDASLLRHLLNVARAQAPLRGDLPVGEIQPHAIPAQHPASQRLRVAGQHGSAQVVNVALTPRAALLLTRRWRRLPAVLGHWARSAVWAAHPLGPAPGALRLIALGIVPQALKVEHLRRVQFAHRKPCRLAARPGEL